MKMIKIGLMFITFLILCGVCIYSVSGEYIPEQKDGVTFKVFECYEGLTGNYSIPVINITGLEPNQLYLINKKYYDITQKVDFKSNKSNNYYFVSDENGSFFHIESQRYLPMHYGQYGSGVGNPTIANHRYFLYKADINEIDEHTFPCVNWWQRGKNKNLTLKSLIEAGDKETIDKLPEEECIFLENNKTLDFIMNVTVPNRDPYAQKIGYRFKEGRGGNRTIEPIYYSGSYYSGSKDPSYYRALDGEPYLTIHILPLNTTSSFHGIAYPDSPGGDVFYHDKYGIPHWGSTSASHMYWGFQENFIANFSMYMQNYYHGSVPITGSGNYSVFDFNSSYNSFDIGDDMFGMEYSSDVRVVRPGAFIIWKSRLFPWNDRATYEVASMCIVPRDQEEYNLIKTLIPEANVAERFDVFTVSILPKPFDYFSDIWEEFGEYGAFENWKDCLNNMEK